MSGSKALNMTYMSYALSNQKINFKKSSLSFKYFCFQDYLLDKPVFLNRITRLLS